MGQRHQVYAIFNTSVHRSMKPKMLAYHNQWCYGSLPLHHVERVLAFNENTEKYSKFTSAELDNAFDPKESFEACLSCDPHEGFYSRYISITDEVTTENTADPRKGDNNDGITVFDFRNKGDKIKYCFMNIGPGDSSILKTSAFIPLSATEYAELYYTQGSKEWTDYRIPDLITGIDRMGALLTLQECMEFFPIMYGEARKVARMSKKHLPLMIHHLKTEPARRVLATRLKEK